MTQALSLAKELETAVAAVRRASKVCQAVQKRLVTADTLEKKDKSPVTVADFASQAVVCAALEQALPQDRVVGEEDAHELRKSEQTAIRNSVVEYVVDALGSGADKKQTLEWIDRGGAEAQGERYWTVDPIDGTKGFLRGEQYAVALALIENSQVVLGVLGCPNLSNADGLGIMIVAVRGQGAKLMSLWEDCRGKPIRVSKVTRPADARFCESVESGHSNQSASSQIAAILGITAQPLRMDSQCKYATVARGEAQIYLRMPTRQDYWEKIWDHAAGMLVVEEAGGKVTDVYAKSLDFAHGRQLETNAGIVATNGTIHDEVLDAVAQVLN